MAVGREVKCEDVNIAPDLDIANQTSLRQLRIDALKTNNDCSSQTVGAERKYQRVEKVQNSLAAEQYTVVIKPIITK